MESFSLPHILALAVFQSQCDWFEVVIQLIPERQTNQPLFVDNTLQQDSLKLFHNSSIVKDTAYNNLETAFLKIYLITSVHCRCRRELCDCLTFS